MPGQYINSDKHFLTITISDVQLLDTDPPMHFIRGSGKDRSRAVVTVMLNLSLLQESQRIRTISTLNYIYTVTELVWKSKLITTTVPTTNNKMSGNYLKCASYRSTRNCFNNSCGFVNQA